MKDDLRSLVHQVERASVPDLWDEARLRTPRALPPDPKLSQRVVAGSVAIVLAVLALAFAYEMLRPDRQPSVGETTTLSPSVPSPLPPLVGEPRISAEIPLPDGAVPDGVAVGAGSAWVGIASGAENQIGSLLRVDLDTNEIVATIPLTATPARNRIAATDAAVWVGSSDVVERIDPATNEVVARVALSGRDVSALAADGTSVWVVAIARPSDLGLQGTGTLIRIDPSTNGIAAEIPLGAGATGYEDQVRIGDGSVWVLGPRLVNDNTEQGGDLLRIDPRTNEIVATIPIDGFQMVVGPDAIWVRSPKDGLFDESGEAWIWVRVDPLTNEISSPFAFDDVGLRLVTDEALWSVGYEHGDGWIRVTRFSPTSLEVQARSEPIRLLFNDAAIDPRTRTIWIAAFDRIIRIDIG